MNLSKLAVELANHECVLVGEFKLSSGLMSPYYLDLRAIPSYPELLELVIETYIESLKKLQISFDRIAGIATAGIPVATMVAYKLKKPFLYVRKEEKAYGTKRLLEGIVEKGDVVLLLDDVATTGGNLQHAVNVLRENGAEVKQTIVLVDREQGARQNLAKMNVELITITNSSELMKELHSKGVVKKDDYEEVIEYIRRGKDA
jgi:orotate phosphoribosyltransferase